LTTAANGEFIRFAVKAEGTRRDAELRTLASALTDLRRIERLGPAYSHVVAELVKRRVRDATIKTFTLESGLRFSVDPRDRFAALMAYGHNLEAPDLDVFCRLAESQSVIVDVGANFGLYAICSGGHARGGKVFAFEPIPEQLTLLQTNIADNNLEGIVFPRGKAVAEVAGVRQFFISESASFSGFAETGRSATARSLNVECVTLDTYDELSGLAVDLLKIDVEGAELEVLLGAKDVIARSPNIVMLVEANSKNLSEMALNNFANWMFARIDEGFVLIAGFGNADEWQEIADREAFLRNLSGNVFLTRRGTQAEQRLREAIAAERRTPEYVPGNLAPILEVMSSTLRSEWSEFADDRETARLAAENNERDEAERAQLLANNEQLTADLMGLQESPWWQVGSRFVFPMIRALGPKR
jgi:FkbM family methyltransferase